MSARKRGWVHPDQLGRGIGTALTLWGIDNGLNDIPQAPQGARIINICGPRDGGDTAERLLRNNGYHLGRIFLEMTIDIDDTMERPRFPHTVSVRTFWAHDDIELVSDTQHEAFRDHFGWIDMPSGAIGWLPKSGTTNSSGWLKPTIMSLRSLLRLIRTRHPRTPAASRFSASSRSGAEGHRTGSLPLLSRSSGGGTRPLSFSMSTLTT